MKLSTLIVRSSRTASTRRRRMLAAAAAALLALLLAPALTPTAAAAQPLHRSLGLLPLGPRFVTASSFSPGTRLQTVTVDLAPTGLFDSDLYVAWVCEFDAPGHVQVSDPVNGAWRRGPSETFSDGGGDIALYYVQARYAPRGVTVTISASAPTFISGSVAQYRNMPFAYLDSASIAEQPLSAQSTDADSGQTKFGFGGELLFGSLITGGLPGTVTIGSSQGVPLTQRSIDDSGSALAADVLSTRWGRQHAEFHLQTPNDWYVVAAVFHSGLL